MIVLRLNQILPPSYVAGPHVHLNTDEYEVLVHDVKRDRRLVAAIEMGAEPPPTYAVSCRWTERGLKRILETWSRVLTVGQPLPTLPLWLAETFSLPQDLETSYEETCRAPRIA